MTYNKTEPRFSSYIYGPDGEWFHTKTYANRGDQLLDGAKLMDEGYDFDGKGNKIIPRRVELLTIEVLSREQS